MNAFFSVGLLAGLLVFSPPTLAEEPQQLEGFEQVMEKGAVPAVREPEYTSPEQADMQDNEFVIGVRIEGTARAYSINLMNKFSVVNEQFGDRAVATIWDPLANAALAYDRTVEGGALTFEASGALYHGTMVMEDDQTHSLWCSVTGEAVAGKLKGSKLEKLPGVVTLPWGDWKKLHPQSQVLQVSGVTHVDQNPYLSYLKSPNPSRPLEKPDKRMPEKMPVFAFVRDGRPYAIAYPQHLGGWKGKAGGDHVFIYRPEKGSIFESSLGYLLEQDGKKIKLKERDGVWSDSDLGSFDPATGTFENGVKLEPLNAVSTFWFAWSQFNDKVKILNPSRDHRLGHSEFEQPWTDDGSGDSILIDN